MFSVVRTKIPLSIPKFGGFFSRGLLFHQSMAGWWSVLVWASLAAGLVFIAVALLVWLRTPQVHEFTPRKQLLLLKCFCKMPSTFARRRPLPPKYPMGRHDLWPYAPVPCKGASFDHVRMQCVYQTPCFNYSFTFVHAACVSSERHTTVCPRQSAACSLQPTPAAQW